MSVRLSAWFDCLAGILAKGDAIGAPGKAEFSGKQQPSLADADTGAEVPKQADSLPEDKEDA